MAHLNGFMFVCSCVECVGVAGDTGYDVMCRFGARAVQDLARLILDKFGTVCKYNILLKKLAVGGLHLTRHSPGCQCKFSTDRFAGVGSLGMVLAIRFLGRPLRVCRCRHANVFFW